MNVKCEGKKERVVGAPCGAVERGLPHGKNTGTWLKFKIPRLSSQTTPMHNHEIRKCTKIDNNRVHLGWIQNQLNGIKLNQFNRIQL
jgi:hypothetical protein